MARKARLGRVARRPSDVWRKRVEDEAAELARGELSPDDASAAHLWSDQLIAGTDAVLAGFEEGLGALVNPSDRDVLDVVRRAVLALNQVNYRVGDAGLIGYETEGRNELGRYFNHSLAGSGGVAGGLADGADDLVEVVDHEQLDRAVGQVQPQSAAQAAGEGIAVG